MIMQDIEQPSGDAHYYNDKETISMTRRQLQRQLTLAYLTGWHVRSSREDDVPGLSSASAWKYAERIMLIFDQVFDE